MPPNIVISAPKFVPIVAYGIGGLAVIMAVLCTIVYSGGDKRRFAGLGAGFLFLMGASALLAKTGYLSRFDVAPPPMLIMIAIIIVIAIAFGFSPVGRTVAMDTPLIVLIGLQSFRLPLELVMHHAGNEGIMPAQLSFAGYSFDIATGIGAVVLMIFLGLKWNVPRKVIWIWNVWGMYCLVAIVIIAITTSPMVRAFGDSPANLNTWVLYFPYVWLPVVLVTVAISGHILITRMLLRVGEPKQP